MSMQHGRRTKKYQDFFTPATLAKEMVDQTLKHLHKDRVNRVLEPAAGTGALVIPLLESDYQIEITCMDIQRDYLDFLAARAKMKEWSVEDMGWGIRIKNF